MKNHSAFENLVNADFSRRITCLRFILAVLVVFIHSTIDQSTIDFADGSMQISFPLYVEIIQMIFTSVLGGVSVPLFFVISAYLFFAKPKSTKENVKSKFKSIVVPLYFLDGSYNFSLFCRAEFFIFKKLFFKAGKYNPFMVFFRFCRGFFFKKNQLP